MLSRLLEGICAGKHSVADFLVSQYGFKQLYLSGNEDFDDSCFRRTWPEVDVKNEAGDAPQSHVFSDVCALVEFVTKRWRGRWVTTHIWEEHALDVLLRRPFFLLVSVDAPVSVRWKRFKGR